MSNLNPFPEQFPTLETERLSLQEFNHQDAADLFRIRTNETFMLYMGLYPMKEVVEAERHIHMLLDTYTQKKGIAWKITEKVSGEMVGYIGFFDLDDRHSRAEVGFGIALEHQNKGFAKEALDHIVDYCFKELNIHSLMTEIDPRNTACTRLVEKCGFQKEGLFRENFYFDGEFLDSAYYGKVNNGS